MDSFESDLEGTTAYGVEPDSDSSSPVFDSDDIQLADTTSEDAVTVSAGEFESLDVLIRRDRTQDIEFKKDIEKWALWTTSIVLGLAFLVMVGYFVSEWRHIDGKVILGWLSATVVETIGIMFLITRHLFSDHVKPKT